MSGRQEQPEPEMSVPQRASLLHTIRAVAWSFIGIRKNSGYRDDLARLNPLHVIAVAIGGVLVFIVSLIFIVNWVVAK